MKVKVAGRRGFTLVELLVVIAIIGILAGVLIPAVNSVRRSVQTAFLRTECGNLEMAIEAYKLKYGDYPPDFSDWQIVERHYRKAFPEILNTELELLWRLCDNLIDSTQGVNKGDVFVPAIMDRAESLVWALGGFSSDPQRPFTGAGGPLVFFGTDQTPNVQGLDPSKYQYNSDRDNALFEFEPANLTLKPLETVAGLGGIDQEAGGFALIRLESSDEEAFREYENALSNNNLPPYLQEFQIWNDLFPVYRYRDGHAPYVYFDSRTYRTVAAMSMVAPRQNINFQYSGYATVTDLNWNVTRPLLTAQLVTSGTAANEPQFANNKTFQILSPGLDGIYGRLAHTEPSKEEQRPSFDPTAFAPVFWQYPTGKAVAYRPGAPAISDNVGSISNYGSNSATGFPFLAGPEGPFELDNVASFSNSAFGDDLP